MRNYIGGVKLDQSKRSLPSLCGDQNGCPFCCINCEFLPKCFENWKKDVLGDNKCTHAPPIGGTWCGSVLDYCKKNGLP